MFDTKKGFTLLEVLIVVCLLGILAAIAAPGWIGFTEGRRLTTAMDKLYLGIREAQTVAQTRRTRWQFSLREIDGSVEWSTHSQSITPSESQWNRLESNSIQIDSETTFAAASGVY